MEQVTGPKTESYQKLLTPVESLTQEQVEECIDYIVERAFRQNEVGRQFLAAQFRLDQELQANPEANSEEADRCWEALCAHDQYMQAATDDYAALYGRINSLDAPEQELPTTSATTTNPSTTTTTNTNETGVAESKSNKLAVLLSKRPGKKTMVIGALLVLAVLGGGAALGLGHHFNAHSWMYNQGASLLGRVRAVVG